jgi:hypothetical protein
MTERQKDATATSMAASVVPIDLSSSTSKSLGFSSSQFLILIMDSPFSVHCPKVIIQKHKSKMSRFVARLRGIYTIVAGFSRKNEDSV